MKSPKIPRPPFKGGLRGIDALELHRNYYKILRFDACVKWVSPGIKEVNAATSLGNKWVKSLDFSGEINRNQPVSFISLQGYPSSDPGNSFLKSALPVASGYFLVHPRLLSEFGFLVLS